MKSQHPNDSQLQLPGVAEPLAWAGHAQRGEDPLALAIASNLNHAAERDREAVSHRGTMCSFDILRSTQALRQRVESGDALSVIRAVAVILAVPTEAAPYLVLRSTAGCSVWLDVDAGCTHIDFRKTVSPRAAKPPRIGNTLAGSLSLAVPFPNFLADCIRSARRIKPFARTLGALFPCAVPDGHLPIIPDDMGRLRSTPVRLRRSLAVFAIDLGIDRYYAALVTCAFHLVPRARFYYTVSDTTTLSEARRQYYAAAGWGPPACDPAGRPFGSSVVVTDRALSQSYAHYADALNSNRPPKRWRIEAVIEFHNAYILASAWMLIFCCGPRAMKKLRFQANSCVPGVTHLEIADKRVGGHNLHLSMTVCRLAGELIDNIWEHLTELRRRALSAGVDPKAPWIRHLSQATERSPVPLFFLVERDRVVEIGTRRVLAALPKSLRPVANWSRHYWQTKLLAEGVPSSHINVWARHMLVGDEANSSTSIVSRSEVQRQLAEKQDAVLARLGFAAFRGLVVRSAK